MPINHKSIAVDGVGFGHKAIAVLGFRWLTVEVVPPIIIESGGGGYVVSSPAKLVIRVRVNGKEVKRIYEITNFYGAVEFVINRIGSLKLSAKFIQQSIANAIAKATLNKVSPSAPKIHVEQKEIEFKVRRKK